MYESFNLEAYKSDGDQPLFGDGSDTEISLQCIKQINTGTKPGSSQYNSNDLKVKFESESKLELEAKTAPEAVPNAIPNSAPETAPEAAITAQNTLETLSEPNAELVPKTELKSEPSKQ
ncbi:hypothetical protein BX661DRAFT_26898 [Kickxella alabastrina]|uniref:uncharacterized protein n=1 Tax=Kickxella alabastrina TaxID=61397 RepID=UPI00221E8301|nr:uncharacterized protein BX661DRAFT_26898 [Kickxella alabastrina]KAI7827386.1 hypothetical protein BX661DRAFT_26898 [Kickxella alabastrina]